MTLGVDARTTAGLETGATFRPLHSHAIRVIAAKKKARRPEGAQLGHKGTGRDRHGALDSGAGLNLQDLPLQVGVRRQDARQRL